MSPVTSSKSQLLQAFEKILQERRSPNAKVESKEQEAQREQNAELVTKVSSYTRDRLITDLATLHLDLGNTIDELTAKLSSETDKLSEIKQAIEVKKEELEYLKTVRVVADTRHLLTQEHQAKIQALETDITTRQEALQKESDRQRKLWLKEQELYETGIAEETEQTERDRQYQETDYTYDIEKLRQIDTDNYEERKRKLEHELRQRQHQLDKDWQEREAILTEKETEYNQHCEQITGFEEELKQAYIKAKEEAIQDANRDGKVKSDLLEKEWTGTQQAYELQIQSLEQTIQRQTEQISTLSDRVQDAVNQAKELAMRAFASA
ncbi:hypothetical protein [Roseofilum casamattae]|uniref:Uncharacterized protein n=1 Tax=Roseofilum casamattae BLCC-M143 TaxID=3022442 RepID=A0ABT7C0P0_9CYAN|nr:hypothetical protein [Roseofilum casamattae]MDJ1184996.1 hypothetical protein [Roseofilum casamattae BLCC-M143]